MCVRYSQFWCSVPSFIAHQPSDQNISAKRMPQPPQQREWETEPARVALNSQLTQSIKMKWLLIISNSSCFVVFLSVFFFFFSFLSIIFIKIEIYYYILIDFHYVMLLLLVALSARSRFVWDIWGVAVVEDALPCLVLSCLVFLYYGSIWPSDCCCCGCWDINEYSDDSRKWWCIDTDERQRRQQRRWRWWWW